MNLKQSCVPAPQGARYLLSQSWEKGDTQAATLAAEELLKIAQLASIRSLRSASVASCAEETLDLFTSNKEPKTLEEHLILRTSGACSSNGQRTRA